MGGRDAGVLVGAGGRDENWGVRLGYTDGLCFCGELVVEVRQVVVGGVAAGERG